MVLLLTLATLLGCDSPEAPTDVSDLMRYLIREFDNPDPAYLTAGADNMADYLDSVDYSEDSQGRSTIPDALRESDLGLISHAEGTVLADCVNVSLAHKSPRPITEFALLQAEEDHRAAEPTAVAYARTWDDEPDPTCFAERSCELLRTTNIIERGNLLFQVEFELFKHFRWAETSDGRSMIVARSWFDGIFPASRGTATLRQSYTLDVFLQNGEGTDRVQVLWSDTTFEPPIDPDIKRNTTRLSIDDSMWATDEAVEDLFGR